MKITLEKGNIKEVEAFMNDKEKRGQEVIIDGRFIIDRWGEMIVREIEGTEDEISLNFTAPKELYEDHPSLKYEIPFWIYLNLKKEKAEITYYEESNEIEIKTISK